MLINNPLYCKKQYGNSSWCFLIVIWSVLDHPFSLQASNHTIIALFLYYYLTFPLFRNPPGLIQLIQRNMESCQREQSQILSCSHLLGSWALNCFLVHGCSCFFLTAENAYALFVINHKTSLNMHWLMSCFWMLCFASTTCWTHSAVNAHAFLYESAVLTRDCILVFIPGFTSKQPRD